MTSTLTIGDFSRATHLGVETLRHYHQVGLLEPVGVDAVSGYRRHAAEQIVTSQIIRCFRDLDMPLDDIHAVLDEIAEVIAFLASDKASYLTGVVLAADGGRTAIWRRDLPTLGRAPEDLAGAAVEVQNRAGRG